MSVVTVASSLRIRVNGATFFATPCTVESTELGVEDHGILTCYLRLEWPGSGVGFGGHALDAPVKDEDGHSHRVGSAFGCEFIRQTLETVGAPSWEKLPGSRLHVLFEHEHSLGRTAAGIASYDLARALVPGHLATEMLGLDA